MKTKITRLFSLFLILTAFTIQASAELTEKNQKALSDFVKLSQAHTTPKKFLEAIKNKLPAFAYNKMAEHLKDLGSEPMPKLSLEKDTVIVEYKGKLISMRVISALDQTFEINSKILDFSKVMDVDARWQLLSKNLPKLSAHQQQIKPRDLRALMLMEPAYADDAPSAERLFGPLAGTAAVGILAATNLWNPYGWALMGISYVAWNDGICDDMERQAQTCWYERNKLDKKLKDNKSYQAYKGQIKKSRVPRQCTSQEPDSDERDIFSNLKSFVHGMDEKSRYLATCEYTSKNRDFEQCVKDYTMQVYYLCIDVPQELLSKGETWAQKSGPSAEKNTAK